MAFTGIYMTLAERTVKNGEERLRTVHDFGRPKVHERVVLWNNAATYKKFSCHTQLPTTQMGDESFLYGGTSSTNILTLAKNLSKSLNPYLLARVKCVRSTGDGWKKGL